MDMTHEGGIHIECAMNYFKDIYKRLEKIDRKLARMHERGKVRIEDLQAQIDEMKDEGIEVVGFEIPEAIASEPPARKRKKGRVRTPARARSTKRKRAS